MAVFSNFEGTMKRVIQIGKKGIKLITSANASELRVTDSTEGTLKPISVAEPTIGTHAVTLSYLQSHGGGGGGAPVLWGRGEPTSSMGQEGSVYFRINDTNIINIYIKDTGLWKPFDGTPTPPDDFYVTASAISASDFSSNGDGTWSASLSEGIHGRGAELIIQIQNFTTGAIVDADIVQNVTGDLTITISANPVKLKVLIIGATTMALPYSRMINKADWVLNNTTSKYEMTILATDHGMSVDTLMIGIFENAVDGPVGAYPIKNAATETNINSTGDVKLISNTQVSGKIVISGH